MRTEFTRPKFLFLYLSLGLLFTRRAIAINNKHPLLDLHTNALRNDFNDCMDRTEKDNLKFHSCQGFSSIESCRCFFLKEVDHQCKSLGVKSSNYWYFEHQILTYCKNVPTTAYSVEIPSKTSGNNDSKYDNTLGINGSGSYGTDIFTSGNTPEYYPPKSPGVDEPRMLDDNINITHGTQKRWEAAATTLDFEEYYEKKKPNAMTINCKLMRSLKITASPTNHQMTQFSTTILVQNPTGTHTTSIEAIMVLPKNKDQSQDQKHEKRLDINTVNATTNFTEVNVVYLSDASFFSQKIPLILLAASVLLSLIFFPSYTY